MERVGDLRLNVKDVSAVAAGLLARHDHRLLHDAPDLVLQLLGLMHGGLQRQAVRIQLGGLQQAVRLPAKVLTMLCMCMRISCPISSLFRPQRRFHFAPQHSALLHALQEGFPQERVDVRLMGFMGMTLIDHGLPWEEGAEQRLLGT